MSTDQNFENAEFLKEFAQDAQEILQELSDSLDVLRNHQGEGKPVNRRSFAQISRNLRGIQSSAEFLDLIPIFEISNRTADFFESLPGEEYFFQQEEVDTLSAVLGCLGDLTGNLAVKGKLGDVTLETNLILSMVEKILGSELESDDATPVPSLEPVFEIPDVFQIKITTEMLSTYITEAEEHLEQTETCLLGLEKNLHDTELLDNAFRGIHTFKGNSGLFNYVQLEKLGHEFESILENFKSGKSKIDKRIITLLLKVLDVIKSSIHRLPDSDGAVDGFENYLQSLQQYEEQTIDEPDVDLIELDAPNPQILEEVPSKQDIPVSASSDESRPINDDSPGLIIQPEVKSPISESRNKKKASAQNIRVDLYKLDTLMNLVGELIIAENTVTHNPDLEGYDFQNFKKASLQLNRISRELQDISLSLRMIPIEATFHRMVRVVRDVSHKQGKNVELEMEGEDTEIDKSVVETIAGPLLHIIRNAIDHGIEGPEEREKLGKPRNGIIALKAFHEGGEVVIEISDDGKGMDSDKILAKAREKGLVGADDDSMRKQDILELLFLPGFSTASQITDISGRGVGMDVVKRNIELIKGRVHISGSLGVGAVVTIRIPLTLAIIEGMLIRVGCQLFTIPLLSIRESLRTEQHQISKSVDGGELIRIRNRLVPVVRLHELFSVEPDITALTDGILVVVDHKHKQLCLFADEILGQYQTVIKGLSGFFGSVRGISGTSIMSNGDISLILDIQSLVAFALEKNTDYNRSLEGVSK